MENLKDELIGLQNAVRVMNPKHYKLQSEYHRLMYSYTLKIEIIEMALKNIENAGS